MLASTGWWNRLKQRAITLWSVIEQQEIATITGHTNIVRCVAFAPDGRWLASGTEDGIVKLWSVVSRGEVATIKGHSQGVRSVAFSPDGRLLASGSSDGTIKLWAVDSGAYRLQRKIVAFKGHRGGVLSVAFMPRWTILSQWGVGWHPVMERRAYHVSSGIGVEVKRAASPLPPLHDTPIWRFNLTK